ncbi:MAG: D-2-hydroxyacid dehydrogenase [Deltaproteobacteria bacterium]|nr:D-2-hydroxyacid dehydrogenase [Deltaproteobacteria bacterium]
MKIVLLDAFTADQGRSPWPGLQNLGTVANHPRVGNADIASLCAGAEAIITNKAVITADVMQRLQPTLRYVGVSATGTNIVDVAAARKLNIAVTNVPGYSSPSVAQLTIALMLSLSLDVAGHASAVKGGAWASSPDFCFFLRPLPEWSGKTIMIVGLGAIGQAVATVAEALGMRVLAAAVPGAPEKSGRVPLLENLRHADVVSLHCPLTPATDRLVNKAFLNAMKPGALLLNTSRGGLVDEAALLDALDEGHLGGVGLDVLGTEPPAPDHPLLNSHAPWAPRVLVTPHLGWGTEEARARLRQEVVLNLEAFTKGERRNRVD